MKQALLSVTVFVCVILLAACSLFGKNQVQDGDDMIYRWTNYELKGDWVEINVKEGEEPIRLTINDSTIKYKGFCGTDGEIKYQLPEGTDTEGVAEKPVMLILDANDLGVDLVFHEEDTSEGEYRLPVISGTIFEYDGRGEIVLMEFVRVDQRNTLPDDYESAYAKERNESTPVPTYMTIPVDVYQPIADRICGAYRYNGNGDELEERIFTIRYLDKRFYMSYDGEYEYAAAELSFSNAEEIRYNDAPAYVAVLYPFSGFSFAGEYWDTGDECKLVIPDDEHILLTAGQPFVNEGDLILERIKEDSEDVERPVPENYAMAVLEGEWRAECCKEDRYGELFVSLQNDGTIDIVRKIESYPVELYSGYVTAEERDEENLYITAARIGYGGMPYEWAISYDIAEGCPVIRDANSDEFPFADENGVQPMLQNTREGDWNQSIEAGPLGRADEVTELWNEYMPAETEAE